jgi:hypothetical protein
MAPPLKHAGLRDFIHHFCGQLCGQGPRKLAEAAELLPCTTLPGFCASS